MAGPLDPLRELGYFVQREFLLITGKSLAVPSAEAVTPSVVAMSGAAAGTMLGVVTAGLAAAIATGISVMDYNHKRGVLKDLYKEELAAHLGKPKDKITVADLDTAAKTNTVLAEELNRTKKQRNWGIGVAFVATMAAITFVSAVMAAPAIAVPLAGFLGHSILGGLAELAIHAAVGYGIYKAVEKPVEWVADKAFGINDKITSDRIIELERDREAGKVISREQVLSVFVASNPELANMIVAKYGKHFDDLSVPNKQRATEEINQILPLDKLTLDMNMGRINPTELAFAVEGKRSGVEHDPQEAQQERSGGLTGMLHDVGVKFEQTRVGRRIENFAATANPFMSQPAAPASNGKSFVERLGRGKKTEEITFAERVDQSRADPASLQRS